MSLSAVRSPALERRPEGPRIACAVTPLFPLAARLRSEPELRHEALAVVAGSGGAARVVAATRRARRAGIRPGQTLAQARGRLPDLVVRPRDPACEDAAREALLDVAEGFSPRVEDAGAGVVFLDATGVARLYPGDEPPELAMARALALAIERRAGLPVRVGVAGSKLAARVAAEQPGSPTVVPAGAEADFLAPLPTARLAPAAEILATLERWGVRSVGELARLPHAQVVSRLGPVGQELQEIARGIDPRPLEPRQPPPSFREGMELEWPLVALEPFLFVARAALERLVSRMVPHGLGCARLELALTLEPSGRHERSIALPAPTRDVKTLLTLLRLDLESHPPGAPTVGFELVAHPDRPREAQLNLFGAVALSPERLATTLARLFALLGEARAGSPRPLDAHRPEGFLLVPFAPPPPPAERPEPQPARGHLALRVLRPPVPLAVTVDGTETPSPTALEPTVAGEEERRPRLQGRVRVASGPWRLEEGWWEDAAATGGGGWRREYWDVELVSGGVFRLYRDVGSGEWYADGVYD